MEQLMDREMHSWPQKAAFTEREVYKEEKHHTQYNQSLLIL